MTTRMSGAIGCIRNCSGARIEPLSGFEQGHGDVPHTGFRSRVMSRASPAYLAGLAATVAYAGARTVGRAGEGIALKRAIAFGAIAAVGPLAARRRFDRRLGPLLLGCGFFACLWLFAHAADPFLFSV